MEQAVTVDSGRVRRLIEQRLGRLVEIRHDLHAHPQLAYEETYASGVVQRELAALGVPFQAGLAKTGVVAWLRNEQHKGQECLALRADMDALPIREETGLAYASKNPGLMHACGHDGHTAMLLGAVSVLAAMREALPGPVKFFFQPAEEGGAGAKRMIEEGAMDAAVGGLKVTQVYGLHGFNVLDVGTLTTRSGPMTAAAAVFKVKLCGAGGHAAHPETTCDPVAAAAQLVTAMQTIVSRNVAATDCAVVTVAQLHAGVGGASNVIPQTAELGGTIRTLKDETFGRVAERLRVLAEKTAEAFGLKAQVQVDRAGGYPCTHNEAGATARMMEAAREALGADNVREMEAPLMGAEDFAYYGQRAPACLAMLGVRPKGRESYPNLHSPQFDFNDEAMAHGVAVLCHLALGGGIQNQA